MCLTSQITAGRAASNSAAIIVNDGRLHLVKQRLDLSHRCHTEREACECSYQHDEQNIHGH
jgi:hypothetical protein